MDDFDTGKASLNDLKNKNIDISKENELQFIINLFTEVYLFLFSCDLSYYGLNISIKGSQSPERFIQREIAKLIIKKVEEYQKEFSEENAEEISDDCLKS